MKELQIHDSGKPRFQPGAGNRHRSEPEPVEPERETEPPEPEPDRTGTEPNGSLIPEIWKSGNSRNPRNLEIDRILEIPEF